MVELTYRSLKGYKYQLMDTFVMPIDLENITLEAPFYTLQSGMLIIKQGYCWDGPSGPTFDTKTFMRGSLVHDVLYQAIRDGQILEGYRGKADKILRDICLADGMSKFRAWYVYRSVRQFGQQANKRAKKKLAKQNKIITIRGNNGPHN